MMTTIRKGMDILEAFTLADRERSITELSRELYIPQPTIHHILKSLKQRGWIAQDPTTKRYRLGVRLWELGCVAVNYRELSEVLRPHAPPGDPLLEMVEGQVADRRTRLAEVRSPTRVVH